MVYLRNNNTNEVMKMDIDDFVAHFKKVNPSYDVLRFLTTTNTDLIEPTGRYFILAEKETVRESLPFSSLILEINTAGEIINSKSVERGGWSGAIISDGCIIITGWESVDPVLCEDICAVIIKFDYELNELVRYSDVRKNITSHYLDVTKFDNGPFVCISIEAQDETADEYNCGYQATIHLFDNELKLLNELTYEIGDDWDGYEIAISGLSGNILVKHLIPINVFGKDYQSDIENHGVKVMLTVAITPELRIVRYNEDINAPF